MSDIDFKGSLNPEQYRAVTSAEGPTLVLAAAGTGKTRTLVYRVAHAVEGGTSPDRILLLTFTNRAAGEMMGRAHGLVGGAVSGVWGG
ncbi:MAG: UvrD-helicase domain-containing protein, partial [Lentisphaerae bacterium]|nr:UvrD-helicase domain-containing protein [Lentisphaerota bacterium]